MNNTNNNNNKPTKKLNSYKPNPSNSWCYENNWGKQQGMGSQLTKSPKWY